MLHGALTPDVIAAQLMAELNGIKDKTQKEAMEIIANVNEKLSHAGSKVCNAFIAKLRAHPSRVSGGLAGLCAGGEYLVHKFITLNPDATLAAAFITAGLLGAAFEGTRRAYNNKGAVLPYLQRTIEKTRETAAYRWADLTDGDYTPEFGPENPRAHVITQNRIFAMNDKSDDEGLTADLKCPVGSFDQEDQVEIVIREVAPMLEQAKINDILEGKTRQGASFRKT